MLLGVDVTGVVSAYTCHGALALLPLFRNLLKSWAALVSFPVYTPRFFFYMLLKKAGGNLGDLLM